MLIQVSYDRGAGAALDVTEVTKGIGEILENRFTMLKGEDPLGIYQVEGRLNPQAVASDARHWPKADALHLVLTGYDLVPPGMNFTYGATWKNLVSVVSTHRLDGSALSTAVISTHELLHQIGLVSDTQPQYDRRAGFDGHCKNRCLMRAVNGASELRKVVTDWQNGIRLCWQCTGW